MTTEYIRYLIATGKKHDFYISTEWRKLRQSVLDENKKTGCVLCKAHGKYSVATHVHHLNYVRHRPDLALQRYYVDSDGTLKANLICLCGACHKPSPKHI